MCGGDQLTCVVGVRALIEVLLHPHRDHKVNLHTYRQCCSGSKLVDWVIQQSTTPRTRPQVVQMWQALLTEDVIQHGQ